MQHLLVIYQVVIENPPMATRSEAAIRDANNRRTRLRQWIDERFNGSQAEFVAAHKLNQGEISALLKDKSFGSVKARNLETQTGMPEHYLEQRQGSIGAASTRPFDANVEPGPDIRGKVPLISWVSAGKWCDAHAAAQDVHDVERWMDCPARHSKVTFALRVRGDSMTAPHGNSRTYPEGCIIFVDPERRNPSNGDRIVACLDSSDGGHEVTFKIYKNEDGRQWLQPLNLSHEPIRDKFAVLGTVLGKWEDG